MSAQGQGEGGPPDPLAPMGEIKDVAPADFMAKVPTAPPPPPIEPPKQDAKPWWQKVRPRKLTSAVASDILASLEAGSSLNTAALASGVPDRTLDFWMQQGRLADEKGQGNLYALFFRAVTEAQARCEDRFATIIANQAQITWTAAAWMLERKFPARWGQRVQVTVEQELQKAMDKLRKKLDSKDYEKVLEILASDAYIEERVLAPALPPGEAVIEAGSEGTTE